MGPLHGLRIVEFPAIGPVPMCAMLLADLGATILRLDRKESAGLGIDMPERFQFTHRGRMSLPVDLKDPTDVALVLRLVGKADALIEGFRPGVMERLGLGPDICLARNPGLVYGRMTGWGQTGPLASVAGHDINYIALAGALDAIGRKDGPPVPPLNLVGDYAGGSLYMALGLLSALFERQRSGGGQVVDAAIVDGTASLLAMNLGMQAAGLASGGRGENVLDSGAPYYDVYRCADGRWIAVGAIEEKFFAQLCGRLGLDPASLPDRADRANWPALKDIFAARFAERDAAAWAALFAGTDCCVTLVHRADEAQTDPHLLARETFVSIDGVTQPAPAPRFSRSVPGTPRAAGTPNTAAEALAGWLGADEIAALGQ
jgi:alpha-methylacyl-CoA racemase